MTEKGKFQEELKKDFDNFLQKCRPIMDKTGQNISRAAKSAEEDVGRMYKIAQNQIEVQWNNLQKEKVYHRIGKEVASMLIDGSLEVPELEKYADELNKISKENKTIQRKISSISKSRKKSAKANKKAEKEKK